ncbi:GNAT family N-acetyltransferase [Janibacter corallicola]|uniref:GNAT family N-acetyltransferase n=1 Tax=Janibacter corallicola TaxID=415212 RepID=UPI0008349C53|nr:N-acetyltransferase [Janibacter corallicola]
MREDLIIRPEGPADAEPTGLLHDAAFGIPQERERSLERELTAALREDGDVLPGLTFVAELDGHVVGHVVCSRGSVGTHPAVGLGPIAVTPQLQRQGIGAALLMAVVASADRDAESLIALLGDPEYYGFFGFVPASAHGIGSPGPWEEAFQVLPLRAWRAEMAGPFRYAAAFERLA